MNNECKHRDRLMYAIENMNENKNGFFEALENFRKYGSETKMNLQTASSTQIGGTHYINKKIQPWDAMSAWLSSEEFNGFLRGNSIKYLARCNDKGGIDDLRKARHYLDKLIELKENEA